MDVLRAFNSALTEQETSLGLMFTGKPFSLELSEETIENGLEHAKRRLACGAVAGATIIGVKFPAATAATAMVVKATILGARFLISLVSVSSFSGAGPGRS